MTRMLGSWGVANRTPSVKQVAAAAVVSRNDDKDEEEEELGRGGLFLSSSFMVLASVFVSPTLRLGILSGMLLKREEDDENDDDELVNDRMPLLLVKAKLFGIRGDSTKR
jgi:hypothetical protein